MSDLGIEFIPPSYDTTQVLYGVGYLFTAPYGNATPTLDQFGDSTQWATAGWTYNGATDQGVQNAFTPAMSLIQIEETPIPVASLVSTATFQITCSLSEENLANINLAYGAGGTITNYSSGAGQPAMSKLVLSDTFALLACAILGTNNLGYPRVYYVPKIMSAGTVTTNFRRAANARLYPITLNALCDLSQIAIYDFTGAATS
jgi:hypothetical protein